MGFWRRLFGGSSGDELKPQRLDYLNEALALERQGDYEAALTSYRLALRDHPHDARIQQNMAIALTKRSEEHTSELQSPCKLVCRLLLEKKKKQRTNSHLMRATTS